MDALTRVLHALRLEPEIVHRLPLVAPWGIQMATDRGANFHIIEQGAGWLALPNAEPIPLAKGDLVVVTGTPRYHLLDQPGGESLPLPDLLARRSADGTASLSPQPTGSPTVLLCGEFRSAAGSIDPLFSVLPRLIHIKGEQGRAVAWLATPLEHIAIEMHNNYPGRDAVISRLMDILFIMVIRYWIVHRPGGANDWFGALYHPQIGVVLGCMHQQPDYDWTVEKLAAVASLSRSALAAQFTALVGEPPMKYLTRWRMQLAILELERSPTTTLDNLARQVGYESAYAFSKAFKRLMGLSPREYRRRFIAG